jgi:hypothetical protein
MGSGLRMIQIVSHIGSSKRWAVQGDVYGAFARRGNGGCHMKGVPYVLERERRRDGEIEKDREREKRLGRQRRPKHWYAEEYLLINFAPSWSTGGSPWQRTCATAVKTGWW